MTDKPVYRLNLMLGGVVSLCLLAGLPPAHATGFEWYELLRLEIR